MSSTKEGLSAKTLYDIADTVQDLEYFRRENNIPEFQTVLRESSVIKDSVVLGISDFGDIMVGANSFQDQNDIHALYRTSQAEIKSPEVRSVHIMWGELATLRDESGSSVAIFNEDMEILTAMRKGASEAVKAFQKSGTTIIYLKNNHDHTPRIFK